MTHDMSRLSFLDLTITKASDGSFQSKFLENLRQATPFWKHPAFIQKPYWPLFLLANLLGLDEIVLVMLSFFQKYFINFKQRRGGTKYRKKKT